MYNRVADIYCKDPNLLLAVYNEMIESGMSEEEALSRLYAFCPTKRDALYLKNALPISWNNIFICPDTRNVKDPSDSKETEKYIKWLNSFSDMKFDYIIQNPPYDGKRNLFVKFFNEGLNILSENGRMVIIGPATWLINLRKNGKASLYNDLKDRIFGQVVKVEIENQNKPFGTGLYVPFATITIDTSKAYDTIEFVCCGEHKTVKSIYDCNLVGDYGLIWSIIEKCQKFGDMMESHVTKEDMGNGTWYTKYADIIGNFGCCAMIPHGTNPGLKYDSDVSWEKTSNGTYHIGFISSCIHNKFNELSDKPLNAIIQGGKKGQTSDKIADCIYGTREELENWKHFIFNNKLPLFLNIVLTIDQHNNSKPYLPWLVDKQYTDEEINKLFGFTDEEIKLINRTIEKYERNSPWFQRYMFGPDSVSDEEVQNFIDKLNEKYA